MFPVLKSIFAPLLYMTLLACSQDAGEETIPQTSNLIQPRNWWESLPRPVYASLEKVDTRQSWFEVYRLQHGTWALYEPFQFEEAISYLVAGKDRAVVIDTGTGIGDLAAVVRELTDLPVSVVNTHTHWDHIGDNAQFTEIACFNHPDCIAKLCSGVRKDKLRSALSENAIWKSLPEGFDEESWMIPPVEPTQLLEHGDIIDLGERSLEVIYTPGHSPCSICLLDPVFRLLFTGDTFFPGPLYAHPEDVVIEDYITSIDTLKNRLRDYDIVCAGHNDPWVKSEVIPRVAQAFATIMSGKGTYAEDQGLRRYRFEGFDILIRSDQIRPPQEFGGL